MTEDTKPAALAGRDDEVEAAREALTSAQASVQKVIEHVQAGSKVWAEGELNILTNVLDAALAALSGLSAREEAGEIERLHAKLRQVYRYNLLRDYPLLAKATEAELADHVEALMLEEPCDPASLASPSPPKEAAHSELVKQLRWLVDHAGKMGWEPEPTEIVRQAADALASSSPPKEAAQDMVMRDALSQIKATVCGDKNPRWSGDGAIFATRARIADICDRALAAAPAAVDVFRCEHEWTDARNSVIKSGEICLKCGTIRPGNATSRDLSAGADSKDSEDGERG